MQTQAGGNFVLNFAGKNYNVVLSPTGTTHVVNLRGDEVPFQFIQVNNLVSVTGISTGSTINAQVIVVQTNKDGHGG